MASVPRTGPGTRDMNAHFHPVSAAISGTIQMLTMVSRKPPEVCTVSAVPTWARGLYSETSAENWAE